MEGEQLFDTIKFALVGTVVGAVTAFVGDAVNRMVAMNVIPQGTSPAGQMGRAAFTMVASTSIAATVVWLGDTALTRLTGGKEDPIGRVFFTFPAIMTMQSSMVGALAIRTELNKLFNAVSRQGPSMSPPAPSSQPAAGKSCGASCGQ